MRTHELKTRPRYFAALASGAKTFEARKNDRNYREGDTLHLREWEEGSGYTGRELWYTVSHVMTGETCVPIGHDVAILGIRPHGTYIAPGAPTCETCGLRPCMEQTADSWGPDFATRCGPCIVNGVITEVCDLARLRDVVIAHLGNGDTKGAMAALTMQRDMPEMFRAARYDGEKTAR